MPLPPDKVPAAPSAPDAEMSRLRHFLRVLFIRRYRVHHNAFLLLRKIRLTESEVAVKTGETPADIPQGKVKPQPIEEI